MGSAHFAKKAPAIAAALVGVVGMLSNPSRLQAQSNLNSSTDPRVEQGWDIAPVNLNVAGKDRNKVGLGSYFVNAIGDCNGCHSGGTAASLFIYPYTPGHNPYFNQREQLDTTVYLNGGAPFGTVGTPTGPLGYAGPAIITRNLTPNFAGQAEGGHSLSQFKQILRTGIDFDHIHPPCSKSDMAIINSPPKGVTTTAQIEPLVQYCIPGGVIPGTAFDNEPDGNLLQIMPWATFSHLTDDDIEAIYEYISAIPCIDNTTNTPPDGAPNELHNDCGTPKVVPEKSDSIIHLGAPRSRR